MGYTRAYSHRRKFNGETFYWVAIRDKKSDAQKEAEEHRRKGRQARVVKVGGKWLVYARK